MEYIYPIRIKYKYIYMAGGSINFEFPKCRDERAYLALAMYLCQAKPESFHYHDMRLFGWRSVNEEQ